MWDSPRKSITIIPRVLAYSPGTVKFEEIILLRKQKRDNNTLLLENSLKTGTISTLTKIHMHKLHNRQVKFPCSNTKI